MVTVFVVVGGLLVGVTVVEEGTDGEEEEGMRKGRRERRPVKVTVRRAVLDRRGRRGRIDGSIFL